MPKVNVNQTASLGAAMNLAAGHVGEMTGAAMRAAGRSVGCPVMNRVGRAVESAGRVWSDTAVAVARRDADRIRK